MSVLSCIRWAREQRLVPQMPSRLHGDALLLLSTFANPQGECSPAVATLAKYLVCSRQHAHNALRDLELMGLLYEPQRRGQAPAVRRLRLDAPSPDQLELVVPDVSPRRHRRSGPMSTKRRPMSTRAPSNVTSGVDTKYEVLEEEPPVVPHGNRERDQLEFLAALRKWVDRVMPEAGEEEFALVRQAVAKVRWRERMDVGAAPVSRQEVIDYVQARRPDLAAVGAGSTHRGGGAS